MSDTQTILFQLALNRDSLPEEAQSLLAAAEKKQSLLQLLLEEAGKAEEAEQEAKEQAQTFMASHFGLSVENTPLVLHEIPDSHRQSIYASKALLADLRKQILDCQSFLSQSVGQIEAVLNTPLNMGDEPSFLGMSIHDLGIQIRQVRDLCAEHNDARAEALALAASALEKHIQDYTEKRTSFFCSQLEYKRENALPLGVKNIEQTFELSALVKKHKARMENSFFALHRSAEQFMGDYESAASFYGEE